MSTSQKVLEALRARYNLVEKGSGQYRARSPFRTDSDSPSMALTITDDEHGTWFDHVLERGGSLYVLAQELGIQPEGQMSTTKRAYGSLSEYALAHGIKPESLAAAGWKEVTHKNRPALMFHTKSGRRWRFLDGNTPHYISVQGYKPCWYGLDERLKSKLEVGDPLVITNGEISTIAARLNGLAAACVTSGEKDIPKHLLDELQAFTQGIEDLQIIIALDCDTKGQRVALQMVDSLTKCGYPSVKAVDLNLSNSGDLADFCMLYNGYPDALHSLKKCKELKPAFQIQEIKRWEILHASQLDKLPPVEWLIPGEIPANGLTVIYGPSGVGKSFLTLDYALRIAQNEPVVYMAGEGISGYGQRVKAWTTHHGQDVGNLYMCLGAVSFMDDDDLSRFVSEVERACKAPSLVIVDTLARSMLGADENSTRDMGKFVAACEQVSHHFDCAVMLVHHTNKGGVAERGSGALRGASDTMIKLLDEDDVIRVECAKSKDSRPFAPYFMRLMPVDIKALDRDGNPLHPPVMVKADLKPQTAEDALTLLQRDLLTALAEPVFEYGASPSELAMQVPHIQERTLYKVLNALKGLGFIAQEAKRQPYCITAQGMTKIGRNPASTGLTAHPDSVTDNGRSEHSPVSNGRSTGSNGSNGSKQPAQAPLMDVPQPGLTHYSEGL